tara:strand:- start:163 stop:1404 length:1242 start_codon:yes stop_codon:yes gene_type:complete
MAFNNFFKDLSFSASDADYVGIFGTTAQNQFYSQSLTADLNSLSAEGEEIVRWVRYRLGEPKIPVELDNKQIFAGFEEANIEYGSIINKSQASNWLSSLYGLNRDFSTQNLTDKLPYPTLDYLMRLANPYATEAGVGGVQNQRMAKVQVTPGNTDYNLLYDFVDKDTDLSVAEYITTVSAAHIDVRNVLHNEPSSVYRYFDPYSSTNVMSQEFGYESFNNETSFYMQPIYADVLRAGMLETSDKVRRSNHSYHIAGDRIRFLPQPATNTHVWIEYTTIADPFNPDNSTENPDPSITGISSIHNIPFTDIAYEDCNAAGKAWIRQYTLAISMDMLGRIRRKFSSVPIPNGEIQLDGDALVQEAIEKQQQLKDELKEELGELNNVEMMNKQADLAEAMERQLQLVPAHSPFLMLG